MGRQWEEKHSGKTVYQLAPELGIFMPQIKRYCEGIDDLRKEH